MPEDDKKAGATEASARAVTIINACTAAGFAALAGPLITAQADDAAVKLRLEEAGQIKATVDAARRVRASAVPADALDTYLAAGKSLAEVKAALFDATSADLSLLFKKNAMPRPIVGASAS